MGSQKSANDNVKLQPSSRHVHKWRNLFHIIIQKLLKRQVTV